MALTLHYYELWAESQAARVALRECKLDPGTVEKRVDMSLRQHRDPAFLKLNPQGEPPVLEDSAGADGHPSVIWDALGVGRYLDGLKPGVIVPASPDGAALTYQWAGWSHTYLVEPINVLVREVHVSPPKNPDRMKQALQRLENLCKVLEKGLGANGEWLNRDFQHQPPGIGTLSYADILVASALTYTHRISAQHFDLATFPRATKLLAQVEALPSFQAVFGGVTLPTQTVPNVPKDLDPL